MAALAKAGHQVTYQSTKERGFKKALKQPTDLVLVAGGDGTTAKVASPLVDSGIPLSVLPLGTANNLARALGFVASSRLSWLMAFTTRNRIQAMITKLRQTVTKLPQANRAHLPENTRVYFLSRLARTSSFSVRRRRKSR